MPLRTSSRGASLLALPLLLVALLIGGLGAPAVASEPTLDTAITNVEAPWIGGGAKSTATLSANVGTWSLETGMTFSYQWFRDGSAIGGATNATYTLGLLEAGGHYSVEVTAAASGYTSGKATSIATGAAGGLLSAPAFENRGRPLIVGSPGLGSTLTATNGHWSTGPSGFTYQWLADGTAISGATQQTLALGGAQVGKAVSVRVTATSGGATALGTSAATAPIAGGAISNVSKPTITGTAKVGETLTSSTGTWSESGTSYTYQWLAEGVAIADATAATFTPTEDQAGRRLTVQVTASLVGFTQGVAESARTAPVESLAPPGIVVTGGPVMVGQPRIGKVLEAKAGTFTPSSATVTLQWFRAGSPIAGATAEKYALTMADLGKTMTVQATYTKEGLAPVVRTSPPTAKVKSTPEFTVGHTAKAGVVTFKIKVRAPAVSSVSGVVKVTEKGRKLGQKTLSSGRATITVRGLKSGKHTFKISLSGGGDVANGSTTVSFKVP